MAVKVCCFCRERTHNVVQCLEKKTCFRCFGELILRRVQKDSPNKGRLFYQCPTTSCKTFFWTGKRLSLDGYNCGGSCDKDEEFSSFRAIDDATLNQMTQMFERIIAVVNGNDGIQEVEVKVQDCSVKFMK
ncbi:hypothetical protein Syun_009564 [Stephania yunnanensis]|uniref:GRF-type domain-containing protein n=1 Tax=Stephania yunnanensis TaxID=152371 RepID=A0AAP0PQZ4_9MAGN